MIEPHDILDFWFEAGPEKWWMSGPDFDAEVRKRFDEANAAAALGQYDLWMKGKEGALALIILLDQFSRNLFRDDSQAFANDAKARDIALSAIRSQFDRQFDADHRQFFYLPFMHSENLADQDFCVALYRASGSENGVMHALEHREIILRFGRFPHRNTVMGRPTSPAEQAYLDAGGFSG